jgi:hypothetical protein
VARAPSPAKSNQNHECPSLRVLCENDGQIRPRQYNNEAKNADQKLWRFRNQENQKKKPTKKSINPLKQIETTENKLRAQCPA